MALYTRRKRTGVKRGKGERGSALIVAILMGAVFTALSAGLMANAVSETTRSGHEVQQSTAMAAAEAGVNDYIAKLTEDHAYFSHYVHPGESTRKDSSNVTGAAGQAWTGSASWTYPTGRDAWRPLDNGYEFNLQITPPPAGGKAVKITSTGRKTGATSQLRSVEVLVRAASVTDFQMMSNTDITYNSSATTRGKIYAGIDQNNIKHSIAHAGTAYGNLYAEGSITQSPTYQSGAQGYPAATIRSVLPTPLIFNTFTSALVDLKQAAQFGGGIYLDDSHKDGWSLTFNSAGTVTIASCTQKANKHFAAVAPTCVTTSTVAVPAVGAIYVNQSVIIKGQVKGKVTVASNADVIIGDPVSYVTPGVDVLGLVAKNEMIVAQWAPTDLTWTAATVVQSGQWRSWSNDGSHGTMTFTGSTATNQGSQMGMFTTSNYNYDTNLLYLQPPYFPVIENSYTVLFFREVTP
jgi:hypothetical protein